MRLASCAAVLFFAVALPAFAQSGVPNDHIQEFGRGIIEDYSDMYQDDAIEYLWIAPKVRLKDYRFEVKPFENLTKLHDGRMLDAFDEGLEKTLAKVATRDKDAPLLKVEGAVFWAQRANRGKLWIPIVGSHVGQAGVGIELVMRNGKGQIVAKMRHSGREGDQLEDSAWELIDDIASFVDTH